MFPQFKVANRLVMSDFSLSKHQSLNGDTSTGLGIRIKNMKKEYTTRIMFDRWISLLRSKAEYEHNARKNGEVVCSPSIDDICNEMIAYASGLLTNKVDE